MHGLVNRSMEVFLRHTYGGAVWTDIAREAQLGFDSFESMLTYDDALTERVIRAASRQLRRPRDAFLEDLGTFLVSHPTLERLRRLLRFGGVDFVEFLHSLDDLQGRGQLALPDLDLPRLELSALACDRYTLTCTSPLRGSGHVIVGLLRAMADDYGALVLLEHKGATPRGEVVDIDLLEPRFAAGRRFDLVVPRA
jgi:hypothetical protein